jgi:HK97 family phage portal protein
VAALSILARFVNVRGGGGLDLEKRALTSSAFVPPPQVGVIDDYLGVRRAMACMTVLACVRVLGDTIASLPWKAYRRDAKGVPKEVKPQPALLNAPFPGFDLFQWKWMVIASMALRGNSYHLITSRDRLGYPTSLLPLHPDVVFLERRPDLLLWFEPIYRIMGEQVPRQDMIHMRRFTLPGDPWGLSPIKQAAVAIGMSLGAEEYGYRYFKESANPSGLLTTEQDLDEAAVTRQQKNWIASHGGRRLPAVLTSGFKWQNLTITPEESQFLATRGFQRSEICIMYGVPLVLLGETEKATAWGTGIAQLQQGAVTFTFRAWTSCVESMISGCLPRGQFVRFDYDALLKGDIEARYKAYGQALGSQTANPWMLANEVRAQEEMDPVDGGDQLYISNRMMPAGFPPAANNPPAPPSGPGTFPMPPLGGGEDSTDDDQRMDADAEREDFRYTGAPRNGRDLLMQP